MNDSLKKSINASLANTSPVGDGQEPHGEIHEQLSMLDLATSRLHQLLNSLEKKLDPVLHVEQDCAEGKSSAEARLTAVGTAIRTHTWSVNGACARIEHLIERVAL